MHLLYVVNFEATSEHADPYLRLIDHAVDWLNWRAPQRLSHDLLQLAGTLDLGEGEHNERRRASWQVLEPTGGRALLVEVTQEVAPGVLLRTRVTIATLDGKTSFRVGISRESNVTGALSPVGFTPVFQPTIVSRAARDSELQLKAADQAVDPRYIQLPDPSAVKIVSDLLEEQTRLPVLLIHTRQQAGWDFARVVAGKLVGLVRVVTLSNYSRQLFNAGRPEHAIPLGGARLVWSDASIPGPVYHREEIEQAEDDQLRAKVMRQVAPLSALYRGVDEVWQVARSRVQSEVILELAARAERAQADKDIQGELEALRAQVSALQADSETYRQLADTYAREASALDARMSDYEAVAREADYWREMWHAAQKNEDEPSEQDPWVLIPALAPGSDPTETFLAIQDAADDRIVFTDNAIKSWASISYPEPEEMQSQLISLARAAVELYNGEPKSMGHVGDWFKTQYGINVAQSDERIKRNSKLRYFHYDGQRHDQTPHVKVGDVTSAGGVGRIHFAYDKAHRRLVVNHVAVKLYAV